MTSADAGGSPSTRRPPGAATTSSASRSTASDSGGPGCAVVAEQAGSASLLRVYPLLVQRTQATILVTGWRQIPEDGGGGVRPQPERIGHHGDLGHLAAVGVAHRHAVARVQLNRCRGARPHPPALEAPVDRPQL